MKHLKKYCEEIIADVVVRPPVLGVVVPCYNEQDVLPETREQLSIFLRRMMASGLVAEKSAIYFVDDGSKDGTWHLIERFSKESDIIHGIKLSRNRGHQNALLAGLSGAKGDVLVSIDADLQDDINVIEAMLQHYLEGYEIVYGVRRSRERDTIFKRGTAQLFYKILKFMGVEVVYNHADYRLMSRRVVGCLQGFEEVNLFLRGIIPQLGFKTIVTYYDRTERFAGESKYPLRKMLGLAIDGITSFSVVPLRMISILGIAVCLASLAMTAWIVFGKYLLQSTIPGWASSVLPIYFLGGVQLLSIGVLGEYISKIYMETKRRPRYFVEKCV
jgi:glycosyltransferase involved in cell wall biosynthesis